MQAHRMCVVVPENRRATIEFPRAVRSGPVELIVLVPTEDSLSTQDGAFPGRGRIKALAAEFAKDPRQFRELTPEERSARLERVMGVGGGILSTSEEFARQKRLEVELEESKFAR